MFSLRKQAQKTSVGFKPSSHACLSGITTINHLFFHFRESFCHPAYLRCNGRSEAISYSTDRFAFAVFALREYLLEAGLEPGSRIALISENRPEWHVADFAAA